MNDNIWYLTQKLINEWSSVDKCFINWELLSIEEKVHEAYTEIFLFIDWYQSQWILWKIPNPSPGGVVWWSFLFYSKNDLPKIWDDVNFLIDKNDYTLLPYTQISDWLFKSPSWKILKQEINKCEFEEDYSDYYLWWIIISFIFILLSLFLIIRLIKKK